MSDFTINEPGYYTAQSVAKIEEFEPDQYGNTWYSVRFVGDADTFMWLAKHHPEEGKQYYGHLEPTKSGKRLRFKTDKVPEDPPKPAQGGATQSTDESIARAVALKAAVGYHSSAQDTLSTVIVTADTFLAWLQGGPTPPQVNTAEAVRDWDNLGKKADTIYDSSGEPLPPPPDFLQEDER